MIKNTKRFWPATDKRTMKQFTLLFLFLLTLIVVPFSQAQSRTYFYYYPSYRVISWGMPSIWGWNRTSPAFWPPKYPPVAAYDQRLIDYTTSVGETQRLAWLAQQKAKNKAAQNTTLPSFRIETQKNQNNN